MRSQIQKRKMVEHHRGAGADVIDAWRCSNCGWSYDAKRAFGKYDLPDDIRKRAEQKFVEHVCSEHAQNRKLLKEMVGPCGLEPQTGPGVVVPGCPACR